MMTRIRKLLSLTLAAACLMVAVGCDYKAEEPAPIYDDVGETDIVARERLYQAQQKAKQDAQKNAQAPRAEAAPAVPVERLIDTRPAQPRAEAPRVAQPRQVPAPRPIEEAAPRKTGVDERVRHHWYNVGEIELEY
ncbi:MAG: hypothetical protein HS116_20060 [Planctomycetes bacterium]|nr:hypothetical protein [Planctomycetota bacterium]